MVVPILLVLSGQGTFSGITARTSVTAAPSVSTGTVPLSKVPGDTCGPDTVFLVVGGQRKLD